MWNTGGGNCQIWRGSSSSSVLSFCNKATSDSGLIVFYQSVSQQSLFLSCFFGVEAVVVVPLPPPAPPGFSFLTNCIIEKNPWAFVLGELMTASVLSVCLSLALCPQATLQPSRANCFMWTPPAACSTGPFWRLRCWQWVADGHLQSFELCFLLGGVKIKSTLKKKIVVLKLKILCLVQSFKADCLQAPQRERRGVNQTIDSLVLPVWQILCRF